MKRLKKTLVVLSAIVMAMALLLWIVPVILSLGCWRHPPLQEQLQEGKWIVRQLEQFREEHGRYPDETEADRLVPGKLMLDPTERRTDQPLYEPSGRPHRFYWYYFPHGRDFVLYRATGLLNGERLCYSDRPFRRADGTDGIPRWYLRVEGGPIRTLLDGNP